ncbi:MAG: TRIC cation channel family protein [Thermomicrobiales bacterium]|nr:TRIC cation channel family protein [Thermomicrobiales bacterium]
MTPDLAFRLPLAFEYGATLLWALSGALLAARLRYDIAGIAIVALVSATGGGLLRDGIFINDGPPQMLRTPAYIIITVAVSVAVWMLGSHIERWPHLDHFIVAVDAAGIGGFALVGLQISIGVGLGLPAAVFVGVINAVGGGVLRDVLVGREPDIFKPGVPSALAALAGCLIFLLLTRKLSLYGGTAGIISVAIVFTGRVTALRYNLRTRPAFGFDSPVDD